MLRALCVGVNDYPGQDADLAGCVNDAQDMAACLERRGYAVTLLTDTQATRERILAELHSMLAGLAPSEMGVFHFSGHGTWLPDDSGDEADGKDEALCPYGMFDETSLIRDDDLLRSLSDRPARTRVLVSTDSCHSGTVTRFANLPGRKRRVRFLPLAHFVKDEALLRAARNPPLTQRRPRRLPGIIHLAGCRDQEYCYDAAFNDRPNGAFTHYLVAALESLSLRPPVTPVLLLKEVRRFLPSWDYPQTPQLDVSPALRHAPIF